MSRRDFEDLLARLGKALLWSAFAGLLAAAVLHPGAKGGYERVSESGQALTALAERDPGMLAEMKAAPCGKFPGECWQSAWEARRERCDGEGVRGRREVRPPRCVRPRGRWGAGGGKGPSRALVKAKPMERGR